MEDEHSFISGKSIAGLEGEHRAARARSAPETGLFPALLSEIVAALSRPALVVLWEQVDEAAYIRRHLSLTLDVYREMTPLLHKARNRLNMQVEEVGSDLEGISLRTDENLNKWTDMTEIDEGTLRHEYGLCFGLLLRVCPEKTATYLIEIYLRDDILEPPAQFDGLPQGLAKALESFCNAYTSSRSFLTRSTQHDVGPFLGNELPGDGERSLARIEHDLFTRLRSMIGQEKLKELHLFLIDSKDRMLYYATTDQLKLQPVTPGRIIKIPQLRQSYKREHVLSKLSQLHTPNDPKQSNLAHIYRSLEKGCRASDVSEDDLKAILHGLPQELEEGVAGDAVCSQVLTLGGGDEEKRWDIAKLDAKNRFFAQKLALEQYFGVAKAEEKRYLTAAPVYETGQVVGTLFIVTNKLPSESEKNALEAV